MEILIAFLVALGVFGSVEEGQQYSDNELEQIRLVNHDDLADQFEDEYLSIFGIDETEVN